MPSIRKFSPFVAEQIGFYVYGLIDPRDNEMFYIGKGIGNRVFEHAEAAMKYADVSEKLDRIRAIHAAEFEVSCVLLRHGLTEKEAFEVEAALIDFIGLTSLSNEVLGHNSDDRGRMTINEVIVKYDAQPAQISEPVVLITVNQLYRRGMTADELYEITRGNWVMSPDRRKPKYAFTVFNGIIREVYEIESWHTVTARNPAQKTQSRWRFDGKVAEDLRHYVNQSTVNYTTTGSQNPIRYINC